MQRRLLTGLRAATVVAGTALVYSVLWLTLWVAVPVFVFGWTPVVLTGGSMQPGLGVGDVVVASPHSGEDLAPGTVIVFEDPVSDGLTTHRIVSVDEDGNYRTRGDGNADADSTLVSPASVRGVGRLAIPSIGLPRVWMRNGDLVPLGVLGIALIGLMGIPSLRWVLRRGRAGVTSPESNATTPVTSSAPALEASGQWVGVRQLLRRNRGIRPLAGLAQRLSVGVNAADRAIEPGVADPDPSDDAEPLGRAPFDGRPQFRSLQRAAIVLIVAAAMFVVLTMSPAQMAAASFVGTTEPGGGSVTADTLDPPTGLTADTSTPGQIGLGWTPTVDTYATGYRVYRSETSGSGYSLVATVAGSGSSSHSDVFTPIRRTYYYVVQSHYGGWASVTSAEATADVGYDGIIEATSGLVGYWRLGLATTTSIAPDEWGPSDGTPGGGFTPQVAGGIVGDPDTAAAFNGWSGDVNVGNDASLRSNSGSIEVWLATANAGNGYRELVSKDGAYYLALRDNVLGVYDAGTGRWRSSGVTVNDGGWHHVVLTYQSGVSNGTKIYLDGSLVLTTTITAVDQTQPVFFGSWYGGAEFYAGSLDEIAIYDAVLTPTVVSQHHQAGLTP